MEEHKNTFLDLATFSGCRVEDLAWKISDGIFNFHTCDLFKKYEIAVHQSFNDLIYISCIFFDDGRNMKIPSEIYTPLYFSGCKVEDLALKNSPTQSASKLKT